MYWNGHMSAAGTILSVLWTLIVIALAEAGGAQPLMVHLMGAGLVISRALSAYTLNRSLGLTRLRVAGAALGMVVLTAASVSTLIALFRI